MEMSNGNIPWATVRDMKWDIITETECTITEEGLKNSSTNIIPKNNVVIATRVGLGKVCLLKKDTAINQDLKGIIPLFSSELSVNYLYWWFKRISNTMIKNGKGATVQGVNVTFVKNLEIPIPTLTEQERIVEILDEALTGIATIKANTERNLQNARELFQSYLQSIFSNPNDNWEVKKLGDVCEFLNGKAHENCIDNNGQFIVVNSKFISSDGKSYKRTNNFLFPLYAGDIVMVMSDVPNGKALAKCFLVDENNKYTLNQRICVIKSKAFYTRFLYYQLNRNPYFLNFDNGENQTNLRKQDILNCPLLIPHLLEQQKIVEKLDALSAETKKLEAIYQQKLNDLEELKKSLLQKAFNGELTNPEKS